MSLMGKFSCPGWPASILHRASLVDELIKMTNSESPHTKLVLLCAPAGYGKTTLLADFAHHTSLPCCWFFLEREDTDKIVFFRHLLTSIRQVFPSFGKSLEAQFDNAIADSSHEMRANRLHTEDLVKSLLEAIVAEIPSRFALVFSHYHEVSDSLVINDLFNLCLQHLPPQCVLMLESRAIPPLDLTSLLVRREVFALSSQQLRFTPEEIGTFMQLFGREQISEEEVLQIEQMFEGWVAGIVLSTHLGHLPLLEGLTTSAERSTSAIAMEREHLFAYMVNEVFSREQEAYSFLKDAIVLKWMAPEMCNALLNLTDADMRLNYLERQGLFVTHGGQGAERFYTCHPVLRELLYNELQTHEPERFRALNLRAMELFQKARNYELAIAHALAAGAHEQAAELIEIVYQHMVTSGYTSILASWIEKLSEQITNRRPRLLLAQATIFLSSGDYASALPLLDLASTVDRELLEREPTLKAEIQIKRGGILLQQGDHKKAQELCQQALSLIPEDEPPLCAEAHLRLGIGSCQLGKFQEGIVQLQRALLLRGCEKASRQTARLHGALALAYQMIGHFALSEHHQMRAMRCWEQLTDEWGKLDTLINLGILRQAQGAYTEAEKIFHDILATARGPLRYQHAEVYALVNLGDLYLDQNRYQEALSALEDGLMLARQMKDTYLVNGTLCLLATTYSLLGDIQSALALLSPLDRVPPAGYVALYHLLASGTILLHRQSHKKAYVLLKEAEAGFRAAHMKAEQIRVLVRLAACVQKHRDLNEARQYIEEALALARYCDCEALYQLELRRTPDLLQAIRAMPGTAHLYTFLHKQEQEEHIELTELPAPSRSPTPESAARKPYVQLVHLPREMSPAPPSEASVQHVSLLRVLALGEPAVYLNDVLITRWRLASAMELFFFLLNAGQAVHKERLLTALWPEAGTQMEQILRSAIYHLRKLLGPTCIISSAGTYRVDLSMAYGEVQVWYDVAAFQQSYARGQAALAKRDDLQACLAFEEATSLYRGDYVQSFFNDWCRSRRQELRNAYIDAHHQLALIAWRQGHVEDCIPHWQSLLAVDQCLEEAHYWLMRCYMQQGKRGMALRQYQRCVDALQEELGIAPGRDMQDLYLQFTQEQ